MKIESLKVATHLPLNGPLDDRRPFKVAVFMEFNPDPAKSYRCVRVACARMDDETHENDQMLAVELATEMLEPEGESEDVNEAISLVCEVARGVFQASLNDLIEQEIDRLDQPDLFGTDPEPSDPVH